MKTSSSENIKDVAKLFLRLGVTAFGGPAAHIAMMQQEVVEKRKRVGKGCSLQDG